MNYPIRDVWQTKGKKYKTKYMDCLKALYTEAEDDEVKAVAQEVMVKYKSAIKKLAGNEIVSTEEQMLLDIK